MPTPDMMPTTIAIALHAETAIGPLGLSASVYVCAKAAPDMVGTRPIAQIINTNNQMFRFTILSIHPSTDITHPPIQIDIPFMLMCFFTRIFFPYFLFRGMSGR